MARISVRTLASALGSVSENASLAALRRRGCRRGLTADAHGSLIPDRRRHPPPVAATSTTSWRVHTAEMACLSARLPESVAVVSPGLGPDRAGRHDLRALRFLSPGALPPPAPSTPAASAASAARISCAADAAAAAAAGGREGGGGGAPEEVTRAAVWQMAFLILGVIWGVWISVGKCLAVAMAGKCRGKMMIVIDSRFQSRYNHNYGIIYCNIWLPPQPQPPSVGYTG